MSKVSSIYPTLAQTIWQTEDVRLRNIFLAIGGSLALWVSAKIQVPFYPIPMTMQTFVVLIIGMTFGLKLGVASVLLYLIEGLIGLPVFAGTPEKGIGLAYMVGPTGGYLLGFVVSAGILGWLSSKGWDRNVFLTLAAMTIGTAIIFIFGMVWLGAIIGWEKPILELGLFPFIPGAAFKIALAAAILPLIWKKLSKHN
jgi:biotin transport system substrate-specific component